ncbi:iron ABC transporter permease [Rhodovulum sulfidophilum]|uniref:Iron ABC transporter permease n=1 Tax=Rhodovulum visakhapatnamense TaxID=364297 RepID=A0ABS1RKI9_9RHOB|nr:iron ABC transporter permease [Rhodovulum visakhapatnamense]MBL3571766.1 iron ABC transporter permease [Rhodovulum visakhapatnamense]MBL3580187.1 iron ABC transporter permease [Rhodovulum visakhapatnamense]OLS44157.1 iron ABC transporter permease [Rhodovulum sulfidophilum]
MADQIAQVNRRRPLRLRPDPWSAGALAIAALVLLPILSVVVLALTPDENIWPHLIATTLPRYLTNTLAMMGGVAVLASAVGAGAAWLVSMYRFPGARWLEWLLLLPLAIPAYVGAYALVDFLEYAGPVQTVLRSLFGWQNARDYWFPEIRSRGAAVLVLSAALYPYVYLLARAAFREQSGAAYEVARALGAGPVGLFWRVGLPLARPAIAAGAAIAMMETVNDFGVVEYFAVQTLTAGIFSVWLEGGNAGGAAQIAGVILAVILALVALEKVSRRNLRFHALGRHHRPLVPVQLEGIAGWVATLACTLPVAVGFALPVGVILSHALANPEGWADPGLIRALLHTLTVGGIAAVLTVAAGLFLVYGVRLTGRTLPRILLPVTTIGYAAPGAVLGVGLLIPMAAADNALADAWVWLFGADPGLLMTGSAFAIVYAYGVRFFAIAQGAADAAMGRIAPSLPMAARSLGRTARGTLTSVYLPLIRTSIGTALLLVFVDCVKELPATLLLRPFNYNTLATRVYDKASLENLGDASPAALLVCLVGLVAVGLLARANR